MFYLILAILTSAMISIVMRLSGEKVTNNIAMLAVNYITCTLAASCYSGPLGEMLPLSAIAMGVINGGIYAGGLVLMQRSIGKSGVVLTSTFMRLGLIVCILLSVVLFREVPTAAQLVGFCLAVGAIILNGGIRSGGGKFQLGLALILLVNGIGDTWVKAFGSVFSGRFSDPFLIITFAVAGVLCLGIMVYKKQRIGWWELLFGIGVAIPNYYNSRFLLLSLQTLPGIIVYPTFSVAVLLLITVLGVCFFKERLTRRQWIAMALILISLALLNL